MKSLVESAVDQIDNALRGPELLPESSSLLLGIVTALQTLSIMYKACHWETKGESFFGDHRFYEEQHWAATNDMDRLAERVFGLSKTGSVYMGGEWIAQLSGNLSKIASIKDRVQRAIHAETFIHQKLTETNKKLADTNQLILGLQDLLPSLASNREQALYLLKQRAAKSE